MGTARDQGLRLEEAGLPKEEAGIASRDNRGQPHLLGRRHCQAHKALCCPRWKEQCGMGVHVSVTGSGRVSLESL